jgi:GTP-binding protein
LSRPACQPRQPCLPLNIKADFIISAASARDFPGDGIPELALVGRSNVGKSSLINALTRTRIARTSAAPGKTRLANVYRIDRGAGPTYLVDLPGYGYARGGQPAAQEFAELTRAYFGQASRVNQAGRPRLPRRVEALLLVDARHPGLESDVAAWEWLQGAVAEACAIVTTKIDKLARGERIRAMRQFESVFDTSVLPVSAVTGEGLDELWKLIDRLANSRNRNPRSNLRPTPPAATARPRPRPNPAAAARNTRR